MLGLYWVRLGLVTLSLIGLLVTRSSYFLNCNHKLNVTRETVPVQLRLKEMLAWKLQSTRLDCDSKLGVDLGGGGWNPFDRLGTVSTHLPSAWPRRRPFGDGPATAGRPTSLRGRPFWSWPRRRRSGKTSGSGTWRGAPGAARGRARPRRWPPPPPLSHLGTGVVNLKKKNGI